MARNRTKWCLKCGRKRVIHSPDYFKDKKPYKCLECGFKHSPKDLGLKVNTCKNYVSVDEVKVKDLGKMLCEHCVVMSKKVGGLHYEASCSED